MILLVLYPKEWNQQLSPHSTLQFPKPQFANVSWAGAAGVSNNPHISFPPDSLLKDVKPNPTNTAYCKALGLPYQGHGTQAQTTSRKAFHKPLARQKRKGPKSERSRTVNKVPKRQRKRRWHLFWGRQLRIKVTQSVSRGLYQSSGVWLKYWSGSFP